MRNVKTYAFCLPDEALEVLEETAKKMGWPNASRSQVLTFILMNWSFEHILEHGRNKEKEAK